jgi:abnormal spindle-like microcephaly-associated protein
VISKLEVEVERMRLAIRKDKNINKDVGMKQKILYLILSYNPLWLRVGLETIYGELLQLNGNNDLVGLSMFLVTRLLSCPDILAEFAHPTVPHSYRERHQEALNKFTLKQFLELVFFLDVAKENKLIQHNPCLFCPDSKIKSSREILLSFSRDYLSGEGDIIKHLAYLKYHVTHKQTALDEFDYAVTNISTDLRCGLRLSKVAEFLTGATVSTQLRVPAVSMLQKVHNTEVALKELRRATSSIPTNITSKDIVNGHREKTLTLLWSIIYGFQLSAILDADKLREEILHLRRSLRVRIRLGDTAAIKGMNFLTELASRSPGVESESAVDGADVVLLKEWAQLVTAHYNVEV